MACEHRPKPNGLGLRNVSRVIQDAIQRPCFRRRAAPRAQRLHFHRQPSRPLREAQHVAAAHSAARLVQGRPRPAARQANSALFHNARGEAARLEEPRPPQPDVHAAGLSRLMNLQRLAQPEILPAQDDRFTPARSPRASLARPLHRPSGGPPPPFRCASWGRKSRDAFSLSCAFKRRGGGSIARSA
jgi:hypothetical protein